MEKEKRYPKTVEELVIAEPIIICHGYLEQYFTNNEMEEILTNLDIPYYDGLDKYLKNEQILKAVLKKYYIEHNKIDKAIIISDTGSLINYHTDIYGYYGTFLSDTFLRDNRYFSLSIDDIKLNMEFYKDTYNNVKKEIKKNPESLLTFENLAYLNNNDISDIAEKYGIDPNLSYKDKLIYLNQYLHVDVVIDDIYDIDDDGVDVDNIRNFFLISNMYDLIININNEPYKSLIKDLYDISRETFKTKIKIINNYYRHYKGFISKKFIDVFLMNGNILEFLIPTSYKQIYENIIPLDISNNMITDRYYKIAKALKISISPNDTEETLRNKIILGVEKYQESVESVYYTLERNRDINIPSNINELKTVINNTLKSGDLNYLDQLVLYLQENNLKINLGINIKNLISYYEKNLDNLQKSRRQIKNNHGYKVFDNVNDTRNMIYLLKRLSNHTNMSLL